MRSRARCRSIARCWPTTCWPRRCTCACSSAPGCWTPHEATALVEALAEVPAVPDDAPDEDVHSYLERCLIERLGELGRKVHAGRSRNDQVAVATRLWAKDAARDLALGVAAAQEALVACARANAGVVLPGYTHLQRAQPILLGHHLAAHAWMLERDAERLRSAYALGGRVPARRGRAGGIEPPARRRAGRPPSSASRARSTTRSTPSPTAISSATCCTPARSGSCTSRAWRRRSSSSRRQEFAFAQLDDTIALGSSIMPQKKNPQVAEHLRGRAGVAIGRLAAMLAVCKGLPLAYDSDLQEDKELAFAQVASFDGALRATALLVGGLHFDAERMREAAADGATVATDVAEALVRGGMPFREAHEQVASRIAAGERFAEPTPEEAVAARDAPGGTAPARVEEQLAALTWRIAATRAWARS